MMKQFLKLIRGEGHGGSVAKPDVVEACLHGATGAVGRVESLCHGPCETSPIRVSEEDKLEWERDCLWVASHGTQGSGSLRVV